MFSRAGTSKEGGTAATSKQSQQQSQQQRGSFRSVEPASSTSQSSSTSQLQNKKKDAESKQSSQKPSIVGQPTSTSSRLPPSIPNVSKSQKSYEQNKAQTEFYMGLIKERTEERDISESLESNSSQKYQEQPETRPQNKGQQKQQLTQQRQPEFTSQSSSIAVLNQNSNQKSIREQNAASSNSTKVELEELRANNTNLNRLNYEQSVKTKEDKMEIKRLKQKIATLESEKAELLANLKEKDQIIAQGLTRMSSSTTNTNNKQQSDQNTASAFNERRNFLVQSQMIKQRRYIQHLTKLTKSNRTIATELEFQLGRLEGILAPATSSTTTDDSFSEKQFDKQESVQISNKHGVIVNLRKKLSALQSATAFEFAQNLLKEFDSNSDKMVSKQTYLIELESTANKLLQSITKLLTSLPNKSKEQGQVSLHLKEFVEGCLRYGMDVRLSESEYEVIESNESIRNAMLRNVRAKIGGFESPMIEDILFNGQLFEFLHKIQLDRNQLVHRYRNKSAVESVITTLLESNSNSSHQNNSKQSQQLQRQTAESLQRISSSVGIDMNALNQMNNILRTLLFQAQISNSYLTTFVKDQLSHLNKIIRTCIYEPFSDMYACYNKYYISEKNPNYPMHLAKVFNLKCEDMQKNIESIANLDGHPMFENNAQDRIPLIQQIQEVYSTLASQLQI